MGNDRPLFQSWTYPALRIDEDLRSFHCIFGRKLRFQDDRRYQQKDQSPQHHQSIRNRYLKATADSQESLQSAVGP